MSAPLLKQLSRRSFGKLLAASAAGTSLSAAAAVTGSSPAVRKSREPKLIKPNRLHEGDLVGLITPSGHVDDEKIEKSIRNLESLGLRVKTGKYIRELRGNYAGTVTQRLEDLHAMFADREVKAVWAATGGSGAISLLPFIDYALIRKNPKVFVGYSDITALHLAIHRQTGLVTFHGPVASSTFSDYAIGYLRALLMSPQPNLTISMAAENHERGLTQPAFAARTLVPGVAQGRLIGGNLSLVSALSGTDYAARFAGKLLFLEDISEAPYRIDRMMTQLRLGQDYNSAAALMLGIFLKCEANDGEISLTLAETVDDQLKALSVPAVQGYSFGHIAHQFTLPIGVMARIDTQQQTLTLLEAAVS